MDLVLNTCNINLGGVVREKCCPSGWDIGINLVKQLLGNLGVGHADGRQSNKMGRQVTLPED